MSNDSRYPVSGSPEKNPSPGEAGGGRPPTELASHQIRPLPMPTQFFKIPDQGELALARYIDEKISFHIAVFPYFFLIDEVTH